MSNVKLIAALISSFFALSLSACDGGDDVYDQGVAEDAYMDEESGAGGEAPATEDESLTYGEQGATDQQDDFGVDPNEEAFTRQDGEGTMIDETGEEIPPIEEEEAEE